jgi:hypothetical protein
MQVCIDIGTRAGTGGTSHADGATHRDAGPLGACDARGTRDGTRPVRAEALGRERATDARRH